MPKIVILAYYCLLILAASIAGGMIPKWVRLTHRGMEVAVSFVAGVMLGVALFHLLPHAIIEIGRATPGDGAGRGLQRVMGGALGGFLAMFFIERFRYISRIGRTRPRPLVRPRTRHFLERRRPRAHAPQLARRRGDRRGGRAW
jgi:zinc transporter ZupT